MKNKNPFEYQKPDERSVAIIESLREELSRINEMILVTVPECRERSLAITKLEETSMWVNKAIVFSQPESAVVSYNE